ncbi:MAG TPA: DUF3570 domain-containing protein [Labilithrix sp.]|nr:DUF3570 domain-containing protein [Labilithrix sp.]
MIGRRPRLAVATATALVASTLAPPAFADAPADWRSPEAFELSAAAERARAAGLFEKCMEQDEASLALEERTPTRIHLVGCAERVGKVLVALRQMQTILEKAVASRNGEVAELARLRVEQLLRRLGSLTVGKPAGATEVKVTIDGAPVPAAAVGTAIAVDPGQHLVHAEGLLDGAHAAFDESVTLRDGERSTVRVTLRPTAPEFLTPGQLACMQLAKTQQEVLLCMPGRTKPLVVRAALEVSTYADTFAVRIWNPAARASVASPTNGWNVGASYLVDFVSAASPDFVSTASPRGSDTRHAASVNGGYKPGQIGVDAAAAVSSESDYVSRSASLSLVGDLLDKSVTPRIGWAFTSDTIGRGGTSYDVFSHHLYANEASAGASIILSPRTVLVAGVTAAFERGDQSKPYRLIPMFAPGVEVARGASADAVNAQRLPVRPYEQLPLERDRRTLAARFAQRFDGSTLRIEQRLYDDSWQVRASSTDVRFLLDLGKHVTAGPHARLHVQTGATFHQRVYHAQVGDPVVVPVYRTTDRELSPLLSLTGGLAVWWRITDPREGVGFMLYGSGDVLRSTYFDSLYAESRTAGYGTIGLEAELE